MSFYLFHLGHKKVLSLILLLIGKPILFTIAFYYLLAEQSQLYYLQLIDGRGYSLCMKKNIIVNPVDSEKVSTHGSIHFQNCFKLRTP